MKIVTWNVNGIRSVFEKGFREWLAQEGPDIVCLQEIKADEKVLTTEFKELDGYYSYFNPAKKKGYAGTGVYTKKEPLRVETKFGIERFDDEGRCLKLFFKHFTLFNLYTPNGARDKSEMGYKLEVYKHLLSLFSTNAHEPIILAGDFNIAHSPYDLANPEQNQNNTMFTPEERKQLDLLTGLGFVDTFRNKYPTAKEYSWWSYAHNARELNIGWRIDYVFVSSPLKHTIQDAFTRREVLGSDHGPCGAVLDIPFPASTCPVYSKKPSQGSLL